MTDDEVRVRRIAPEDSGAIERFYAELSPASRLLRFHGPRRGISSGEAARLANADHVHGDGFVAVLGDRIVGHVALEPLSRTVEEVAIAVDDRLQHRGIGTLLLAAAFASARLRGVVQLVAWVMNANVAMHRALRASHHRARLTWEGAVARYEIEVPALPRAA